MVNRIQHHISMIDWGMVNQDVFILDVVAYFQKLCFFDLKTMQGEEIKQRGNMILRPSYPAGWVALETCVDASHVSCFLFVMYFNYIVNFCHQKSSKGKVLILLEFVVCWIMKKLMCKHKNISKGKVLILLEFVVSWII